MYYKFHKNVLARTQLLLAPGYRTLLGQSLRLSPGGLYALLDFAYWQDVFDLGTCVSCRGVYGPSSVVSGCITLQIYFLSGGPFITNAPLMLWCVPLISVVLHIEPPKYWRFSSAKYTFLAESHLYFPFMYYCCLLCLYTNTLYISTNGKWFKFYISLPTILPCVA